MKYLITEDVWDRLIFGESSQRSSCLSSLQELQKQNSQFYISSHSLFSILNKETDADRAERILRQLEIVCNSFLTYGPEDLGLYVKLKQDWKLPDSILLEIAIGIRNRIDGVISYNQDWKLQDSLKTHLLN